MHPTDHRHAVHHDQADPGHLPKPSGPSLNRLAFSATVHCLTGCGIGEALGLVIANTQHWSTTSSILIAVILAFLFGYGLSLRPLLKAGLRFAEAGRIALAADTISISVMEIVDNAIMILIPGAMDAALSRPLFWAALLLSLAGAFAAAYPVNRWLIVRGRGHAVMHGRHHSHAR